MSAGLRGIAIEKFACRAWLSVAVAAAWRNMYQRPRREITALSERLPRAPLGSNVAI